MTQSGLVLAVSLHHVQQTRREHATCLGRVLINPPLPSKALRCPLWVSWFQNCHALSFFRAVPKLPS